MSYPSLLDRLLGNGLVYFLLWAVFIVFTLAWLNGENYTPTERYTPFVSGFLVYWATGSRRRVVADRQWRMEKAAVLGTVETRSARLGRRVMTAIYVLTVFPIGYLGLQIAGGMKGMKTGDVDAMIAGWWRAATSPVVAMADMPAVPIVFAALVAGAILWRVRSRGRAAAPRLPKGWDGTVKVLLPVPRED